MRLLMIGLVLLTAAPACAASPPAPRSVAERDPRIHPEVFLRLLYSSYSDEADVTPLSGEAVWSRRMAALILRDQELATDDLPYLDADPICNCQDWEHLAIRSISFGDLLPDGRVDATVRFVNAGEEATTILRLVREPDGWRVDDVVNTEGWPNLADALAQSNARIEAGGKALGRD